jgi:aldehyde dehydrogenase (NAD+)
MRTITTQYIDGKFVPSHGQEVFDLISPVDLSVVGRVTLGDQEDARAAIAAAREALVSFSKTTLQERAGILQRLHDAVNASKEAHIEAMAVEYGAGRLRSEMTVGRAAKAFVNVKNLLDRVPFSETIGDVHLTRKPVGVAALITPWNSDLLMMCHKIAPAIAAGCTVVIKPSELSALQTQAFLECVDQAGVPAGVINVVNGRGEIVGEEFSTNPGVAKVSFTGSTAVGQRIMRNAADTMKRVTLELGGKSATIFLEDADLSVAIPFALTAGFMNSGQACVAGTRLVVPESRLDEIKDALKEAVPAFRIGNPTEPGVAIGPMVTEKQFNRVQGYIQAGIDEGAEVLIGGVGKPEGLEHGYFVKPTVFVGVRPDMKIAREEIFGPVLSVISYRDEDDAVTIANDSTYGLAAYVATTDAERGKAIAERLDVGGVMVNALFDYYDNPEVPIGGFKMSGFGREFGLDGIGEYMETHAVFAH